MIYIASPYYAIDPLTRQKRFEAVATYTGKLLKSGIIAYSPIAHNHPIALLVDLPKDWAFWQPIDEAMLLLCSQLVVFQLPGWDSSVGVKAEIAFASAHHIPITHVAP